MSHPPHTVRSHPSDGESAGSLDQFLDLYAKTQRQRNTIQYVSTQRTAEMAKCLDRLRFIQETMAEIAQAVATQGKERSSDDIGVESFKKQLDKDMSAMQKQSKVVMDIDKEVGKLQFELTTLDSH
ncbi:hypothetical protein M409DRAFT_30566 [Zasmidium cellare ATCC 36951]|uniref:Uncharacterized protein n=1 Tax=Zasmidium cellare ATCC 36951 TaxID=1080233 RepID=A0A6A6BVT1_ZASCE|nr:uncharacterized protein M409DRAFT_30566 [Zasmidium cellare ATCC 36951]KAF2158934.1 hypothetical protein M409DRAFT_30566 [Zasmidium cellare ATCC 36951]